jgi:NAD(P)-dependent dehydrogenase (short-subunit alcohol dehydrogenase family)
MNELAGRTALVTGSGRNIGRAIALELAAMGAAVVVNTQTNTAEAESVAAEIRTLGVEAVTVVGDVSMQETIDLIDAVAQDAFGGIDVLVSNAALRPYQSFLDTTIEDWYRVLDIQLNASFRLAKAFVPGMVERRWGRIIHITGPDAFSGLTNRAHNVVAKGGLRALTKCLALELGKYNITVNDVAPAHIARPGRDLGHPTVTRDGRSPRTDEQRASDLPVGHLGTPEDVAYACRFLASPRAAFYTGTVITCFGGMLMLP